MSPIQSLVETDLKYPPHFQGSNMFMPTGERLYWLSEIRPLSSDKDSHQDFEDIRSNCLSDGTLFEDPEFPATDSSLFFEKKVDSSIVWLRPGEIAENPQLFVKGFSRFDVQQGFVGNCWFMSALANLTLHKKLFHQVVPQDQSFDEGQYAGVFHFRFWQYGYWVDVVVDDRLPTVEGNLFSLRPSVKYEFWSALVEKAYAKLNGTYDSLGVGYAADAMQDFTGGVTEIYRMPNEPSEVIFKNFLKAYERNSLMSASTRASPSKQEIKTSEGLIFSHSYSITKLKYVDIKTEGGKQKLLLLRIRNPWGTEAEWNGPWSDKSSEWRSIPESEKEEMGLIFDADGEFWMSFNDFYQRFKLLEICNLSPTSLRPEECPEGCTKTWEMSVLEGQWVKGLTAGGCLNFRQTFWMNPQYMITLDESFEHSEEMTSSVIIAVMQKNHRTKHAENLMIAVTVYRLEDHELIPERLDLDYFKKNKYYFCPKEILNCREFSIRLDLKPGCYVIMPSTYEPNMEGEFLLRVYSEKVHSLKQSEAAHSEYYTYEITEVFGETDVTEEYVWKFVTG